MLCNFVFGFFFLWKTHTVIGQILVSPSVIEEVGSYTVACDATRAGVPANALDILSLAIGWTAGTAPLTSLAIYKTTEPPPYNYTSIPIGRNWTITFSGSQQGTSDTLNNRNTMKIEIVVYDARCTDAGLYFCNATYFNTSGDIVSTFKFQNVTSTTRAVPQYVTIEPQFEKGLGPYESVNPEGSNVTLTCRVIGPQVLTFTWKYGPSRSDVNSFPSYPVQNDISVAEPVVISSGTTCVLYLHVSILKFQTEYMYDGYMYVCVATENNRDTIVGKMTIHTIQVTAPPSTESENNKNGVNVLYYVLPIVALVAVGAVVSLVVVSFGYGWSGCPNRVKKKPTEPKPTTTTTRRTLPTPPDSDGYIQAIDIRSNALPAATYPTPVIDPNVLNGSHYYSSIDDYPNTIQHVAGDQNYQNTTTGRHNGTMNVNNAHQNSASADSQNYLIPSASNVNKDSENYLFPSASNVNKESENYLIPSASNIKTDSQNYLIPSASNVNKDSQNYLIPLASNVKTDSQNYLIPSASNVNTERQKYFLPTNEFNAYLDIYDTLDDDTYTQSGHQYSTPTFDSD